MRIVDLRIILILAEALEKSRNARNGTGGAGAGQKAHGAGPEAGKLGGLDAEKQRK
jgi:hypothetical protein